MGDIGNELEAHCYIVQTGLTSLMTFNDILIFDLCSDIAVIMAANNNIMAYLFIYSLKCFSIDAMKGYF